MKVVLLQSSFEHDIKSRTQTVVSRKWIFAPCRTFDSCALLRRIPPTSKAFSSRRADKKCLAYNIFRFAHTLKARTEIFAIGRAKTMTELRSTRVRLTRRSRTLRCSSFGVFLQITQSFSPQPLAKKICFA